MPRSLSVDRDSDQCAAVLLAYEYILTVDDERRLIWRRKMGMASWTFLANRAMVLFAIVAVFMEHPGVSVSMPYSRMA